MTTYSLEPVAPSLGIPHAYPCGALREDTGTECGATPAQLFRRLCGHGHRRDVWLCGTHERSVAVAAVCRDCAQHPSRLHRCPVTLVKVPEALDVLRSGRIPLLSGGQ